MWVVAARVVPRAMQSLLQQRAHGFYTVDVDIAWPYVLAPRPNVERSRRPR